MILRLNVVIWQNLRFFGGEPNVAVKQLRLWFISGSKNFIPQKVFQRKNLLIHTKFGIIIMRGLVGVILIYLDLSNCKPIEVRDILK